ncbi:MAG: DNA alkylation repair protein [Fibrobacter sp.]|nr:DNA alkylation repair protein [Fibrobacter sp.]
MVHGVIVKELEQRADAAQAKILSGFFKTGKGQYGEGDIFRGIKVPVIREIVNKHCKTVSLDEITLLLHSVYHEDRLCALLLLVRIMSGADERLQTKIFTLYAKNTRYINNWDLVDLSAPQITGVYFEYRPREQLYKWAKSELLWERRISVLSTFWYIKKSSFDDAFAIIEMLLGDKEDLLHKACGWMLREIGKRDQSVLEIFLKKHYTKLPRTTLRYAIERFEEPKRQVYLKGTFRN